MTKTTTAPPGYCQRQHATCSSVATMPFFGENLKRLRTAAGLTQAELAEKAALPFASIRNWEINHRSPRTDALFILARVLNVPAEAFLEKPKKKTRPKRGRPSK